MKNFDTKKEVAENEKKYGKEIRAKYGNEAIDSANAHFQSLTPEQLDKAKQLEDRLKDALKTAITTGDPTSDLAQQACDLHKQWLQIFYPAYNKEYHKNLAITYTTDPRFQAYYEEFAPNCAQFLHDAIQIYCA